MKSVLAVLCLVAANAVAQEEPAPPAGSDDAFEEPKPAPKQRTPLTAAPPPPAEEAPTPRPPESEAPAATVAVHAPAAATSAPSGIRSLPLSASFGLAAQVASHRSYDLVDSDDHLTAFRVGAAWTQRMGPGKVDIDAALQTSGTSAFSHQQLMAHLTLTTVELGVSFRYPLARFVEPYARVAGGFDWVGLTIDQASRLRQTVTGLGASGTAGIHVPLVIRRNGTPAARELLGFDVGAGYTFRPTYQFDNMTPEPPKKPPEDPIARAPVDLGRLQLSGISYRVMVVLFL